MAQLTQRLPRPNRIEVVKKLFGARKVVTLVFVCPVTTRTLHVKSTSWSLWLKFAISLVRMGVTVAVGGLPDAAVESIDVRGV